MRTRTIYLAKAAVTRASKRAHEIVKFLERERFFQNRGCSDKSKFLFGILLTQSINELAAACARTAYEFQSDENNIVGSLIAVDAEGLLAVGRQSNLVFLVLLCGFLLSEFLRRPATLPRDIPRNNCWLTKMPAPLDRAGAPKV